MILLRNGHGSMLKIKRWVAKHRPQVIAAMVWIAVLVVANIYRQANNLSFPELASELADVLIDHWYGPLIYMIVYLLRPLVLFPASWLTALAGYVFGLWWGFGIAMIAGLASAILPYAVGRWFSEDSVPEAGDQAGLMRRFAALIQRNPFQAVLTMRLLYLPYDAVSILAGSLRIPFISFFLATTIGNIGGTFAYVGLGAAIEGDIASGELAVNPAILLVSVVILLVSLGISRLMTTNAKNRIPAQQVNQT